MNPSPPTITRCVLSTDIPQAGQLITVVVDWDGFPRGVARYQWKSGSQAIRGATDPAYLTPTTNPLLNCVVEVDNGVGSAIAVALGAAPVTPEPEEPNPVIESTYVAGTYVPGVYV